MKFRGPRAVYGPRWGALMAGAALGQHTSQLRNPPYTPVYAFHDPFAWSTARLLQVRPWQLSAGRNASRRWAPHSNPRARERGGVRQSDTTFACSCRLAHLWAPGWRVLWRWFWSYASFCVRCVARSGFMEVVLTVSRGVSHELCF